MDSRVKAIRDDELVGKYSCSSIDECWTDEELIKHFDGAKISTIEAALGWALEQERMHLEQGLNQRWGENNDSQLQAYKSFNE